VTLFGKRRGADSPALTKDDYARTTTDSADSTSLIPPVKDASIPKHAPNVIVSSRLGRTRLRLIRVEPYSVTRLAFVVSAALMIVVTVAVAVFWLMLEATGVWGQINDSVASVLADDSASFDIKEYLGFTRLVGGTLVISGINVILMTALATVSAHLFNLAAALLGGVEATVTDD
jgi:hypothetical protein